MTELAASLEELASEDCTDVFGRFSLAQVVRLAHVSKEWTRWVDMEFPGWIRVAAMANLSQDFEGTEEEVKFLGRWAAST